MLTRKEKAWMDNIDEETRAILGQKKVDETELGYPALPKEKYSIIYADPPWDYKGQTQYTDGGLDTGSAQKHYETVTILKLAQLDIQKISADNALLYMWATSPHLDQAIALGKSWGFNWATIGFVWDKMVTNPGFYTLSQVELCLIFKKGKIPSQRGSRKERQLVTAKRTRHSAKPEEVRGRIHNMFPTHAKIELFARKKSPHWAAWGNEV